MELYAVATDAESGARTLQTAFAWNDFCNVLAQNPLYLHAERDAIKHLYAVAAGLDSLVLGEFEILGQVRRAYQDASENATIGPTLHQLFSTALRLGKRARTETEIGSGALSVASAGVALARRELGTLNGRTALIIGAGEMGRRAAEHLRQDSACDIWIANRTFAHAQELARDVNGHAVALEEIPTALTRADLVITATQAPHTILDARHIAPALAHDPTRSIYFVDLAMPRNIDPAVTTLPGVRLANLDDLQGIVANTRTQRARAIETVQEMIEAEADAFQVWQDERSAAPLIAELYARGDMIRQAELEKTLRRLQHLPLTERDRNVIASLASGIVNKLLATPTAQLKALAGQENAQAYLDAVRCLFDLSDKSRSFDL
jgi:glutamyl-tRNA reductase